MKKTIISDWDGTLVTCQARIDFTITKILQQFDRIQTVYMESISNLVNSPGWIKNGFLASLPEDYFTYHFGLIAQLISTYYGKHLEESWGIVLQIFSANYKKIKSKLLFPKKLLADLLVDWDLFIVSNSKIDNVKNGINELGINNLPIKLIDNAKKYKVDRLKPNINDIMLISRPEYKKIIADISNEYTELVFIGDNFCCDLLLPHSLGYDVFYIPNPLTHKVVLDYINDNGIGTGTTEEIIKFLIHE